MSNVDTPDWWPSGWSGSAVIDCGEYGRKLCKIIVEGDPSAVHRRNYENMLARWSKLWPEIEAILSGMLDPNNPRLCIQDSTTSLVITVPSEPINKGVAWSVTVEFYHDKSAWGVPIDGWRPDSEGAQPYY